MDAVSSSPYRILTVCRGNICRSPMAEFLLRETLEDAGLDGRVEVDSAGVSDEEAGNPIDPRTVEELRRHGHTDHGWSQHVARQVEPEWIRDRDLVLAATRGHARQLRRLAPGAENRIRLIREFDPDAVRADELDMADPWYGDQEGFGETHDEILSAIPGILAHVRAQLDRQD
jgi:protein-tyrosine phosphatase